MESSCLRCFCFSQRLEGASCSLCDSAVNDWCNSARPQRVIDYNPGFQRVADGFFFVASLVTAGCDMLMGSAPSDQQNIGDCAMTSYTTECFHFVEV